MCIFIGLKCVCACVFRRWRISSKYVCGSQIRCRARQRNERGMHLVSSFSGLNTISYIQCGSIAILNIHIFYSVFSDVDLSAGRTLCKPHTAGAWFHESAGQAKVQRVALSYQYFFLCTLCSTFNRIQRWVWWCFGKTFRFFVTRLSFVFEFANAPMLSRNILRPTYIAHIAS